MQKRFTTKLSDDKETALYMTENVDDLKKRLEEIESFIIVADTNTFRYSPFTDKTIVLESGEEYKTLESIGKIIDFAFENNMARDGYFVALGGGVICDMTALAASLYMRGCRLILYPTTLLCMVDATLGGKSAVDYKKTKNLIGTFYPADEVIICIETLFSLSEDEFMSGMGEVVKHAFLSDNNDLYDELICNKESILKRDKIALEKMIELSLLVKKSYIERDPKEERGIRSALNLGHTFGHALESITDYKVSHGEAVVWGMEKALTAGLLLGITREDFYLRAINLISIYPFKCSYKVNKRDYEAFLSVTKKDKKKRGGVTRFVLLSERGEPVLRALDDNQVLALLV